MGPAGEAEDMRQLGSHQEVTQRPAVRMGREKGSADGDSGLTLHPNFSLANHSMLCPAGWGS